MTANKFLLVVLWPFIVGALSAWLFLDGRALILYYKLMAVTASMVAPIVFVAWSIDRRKEKEKAP